MAGKGVRGLNEAMKSLSLSSHTCREAASLRIPTKSFSRSMATEAPMPTITTTANTSPTSGLWRPVTTVPVTIFDFPSHEPLRLESWSSKHLNLPLRRDILHLAVVYEGDNTRQGTASSKTRYDVHGSNRKMRPQKGTGSARQGDKKSPLLRGGGKSFGPHPRDFGTNINRKVYDLAWRTALSYRYRRGELLVCDDGMELPLPEDFERLVGMGQLNDELQSSFKSKWVKQVLKANEWGRQNGRSTFITAEERKNLSGALETVPNYGRALEVAEVDVKDLLETGRLVIERAALLEMLDRHQSDLTTSVFVANAPLARTPQSGQVLVE
ncbi:ribosomal protein L4 [Xylariaceae sp. FL0016]|nr:ribosomal protein L4 [Xylariaceae sp. FL0016]